MIDRAKLRAAVEALPMRASRASGPLVNRAFVLDLIDEAEPVGLDVEKLARVFREKGWMLVDAAKMQDRYDFPPPGEAWTRACAAAIAREYDR